jgi:hypothetical protein
MNAINKHYLYRAVYNLTNFQKLIIMIIFINVVAIFSNSGKLEEFISELHAEQNNNFPCYVRVIYQMTRCHAPESNKVNTKSQNYILKNYQLFRYI